MKFVWNWRSFYWSMEVDHQDNSFSSVGSVQLTQLDQPAKATYYGGFRNRHKEFATDAEAVRWVVGESSASPTEAARLFIEFDEAAGAGDTSHIHRPLS
jgi:hypothetical protein